MGYSNSVYKAASDTLHERRLNAEKAAERRKEEVYKRFPRVKELEKQISMGGIISEYKRLTTKSGQIMAFITLEDVYGSIEAVAFPKVYEKAKQIVNNEEIVKITGKLQIKDGKPVILADGITKLEIKEQESVSAPPAEQEYLGLLIPDDKTDKLNDILDIAESYPGDIPVIVAMNGKKYDAHMSVRRCEGLISELTENVGKDSVIFFKKKH